MSARYLIAIATFRRPAMLERLLDSLADDIDDSADVIVVDNDGETSAHEVVSAHRLDATYAHEPTPGIAAARNRGLDEFSDEYEAIIFVDDDEWVDAGWYAALTSYARESGAGVVQGPVVTVLPDSAPDWIRRGGFYQRRIQTSGTPLQGAATNNTLLTRSAWIRAGSPRFDDAFSTTGGSDADLFWGVRKAGSQVVACADAIVTEDVPPSRLSWPWLRARFVRSGINQVRIRRKHGESVRKYYLKSIALIVVGSVQFVVEVVTRRGPQARTLSRIFIPLGALSALFGYRVHEYRRK